MLQRLKDTFRFKEELLKWLRHSGLIEMLAGNRVAEMYGLSASFGEKIDVDCVRQIYLENSEKFVRLYQMSGLSSRQAALNLVCKLAEIYMGEKQLKNPPPEFSSLVSALAPSYSPWRSLLEKNWLIWLEQQEAIWRREHEKREAFLPSLAVARKEASKLANEYIKIIDERNIPKEFYKLWRSLPDKTQKTEREISEAAGLPLAECIAWIHALERRDVAKCIGTALAEPKYWKTPAVTLKGDALNLRNFLEITQKTIK
ncbi:MAG: hypothetical protein ING10_11125 [Roseomonas sp.]|nr:hypothetical protein [Roseomonas sp.]